MKEKNTSQSSQPWEFTRFVLIIYFTVVAVMLLLYKTTFNGRISDQHDRWGQFGDFMGGILNPLTSIFTLFVAILVWKLQTKELAETREAMYEQNRLNSFSVVDQTLARYFDALGTSIKSVNAHIRSSGQSGDTHRDLEGTAAIHEIIGWLKGKGLLFWNHTQSQLINPIPITVLAIEQFFPIRSSIKATIKYIENSYSADVQLTKYELLRIQLSSDTKIALCYLIWLQADSELLSLVRQAKLLDDFPTEKIRDWVNLFEILNES